MLNLQNQCKKWTTRKCRRSWRPLHLKTIRPDDDSAKLKTPGGTLKQVKDVVNKGAKPAEAVSDERRGRS